MGCRVLSTAWVLLLACSSAAAAARVSFAAGEAPGSITSNPPYWRSSPHLGRWLSVLKSAGPQALMVPDPPATPTAGEVWQATLRAFWARGGSAAAFCLGGRRGDPGPMLAVLAESFDLGPVDRTAGAVCGNDSVVQTRLCTPPEIAEYYEVRRRPVSDVYEQDTGSIKITLMPMTG